GAGRPWTGCPDRCSSPRKQRSAAPVRPRGFAYRRVGHPRLLLQPPSCWLDRPYVSVARNSCGGLHLVRIVMLSNGSNPLVGGAEQQSDVFAHGEPAG